MRINEVQSSNGSTLVDASGATPDWIELFNPGGSAMDLAGWSLTDDSGDPASWVFPADSVVGAREFLVVFASGTGVSVGGELHTNFKLSAAGEFVGLYDTTGSLVSSFDPVPALIPDVSWGVDASGGLSLFEAPTPGAANVGGTAGLLADVHVSPGRGFFTTAQQVVLSADAGASIRYTIDGSVPSATNGSLYSAPIPVSETTVLRSVAVRPGFTSPRPDTHTYVFTNDVPDQPTMDAAIVASDRAAIVDGLNSLPVISLTALNDDGTPRVTWSQDDESPVAVEMIFPDGTSGFQVDAGAKEVGGASTRFPKDSLRLKFGSEWGESSLDYPVFAGADNPNFPATDSFKRLTLRTGAHDSGFPHALDDLSRSFLRARWHDETMLDLGNSDAHGRFVSVFLNGQYWGQYHSREHFDDHFMAAYHGGDNEDYVGINRAEITSGEGTSWDALNAAASNWSQFSQIVDPINYVDFMLMSEYGGNTFDFRAFGNANWRAGGPATVGTTSTGYVFHTSDPDGALVSATATIVDEGARENFSGPADSWDNLLIERDPAFLALVDERAKLLYGDGGALSEAAARARWDRLASQIEGSVHAEYARWGNLSPAEWNSNMAWFRDTLFPQRTDFMLDYFYDRGLLSTLAQTGVATQSSDRLSPNAGLAIDGRTTGQFDQGSTTHTLNEEQPWWQIDLGQEQSIGSIRIWNRTDCCAGRLSNFHVFVSNDLFDSDTVAGAQAQAGVTDSFFEGTIDDPTTADVEVAADFDVSRMGRYVRIQLEGTNALSLAEVQIFEGPVVNTAPSVGAVAPQSTVVGNAVSIALSAIDPDGDPVTWTAEGLPSGVAIDADSGVITGITREAGTFTVTVTATDSRGATGSASFDWTGEFVSPAAMILNEWNAVDKDFFLKNGGSDSALGTVVGNGGDWFELVVIEDHLDVRGWHLEISDANNVAGVQEVTDVFVFADDPLLADLRAGTIITVSEDFGDDVSFDMATDDWHINLQANSGDAGAFFTSDSQSNFGVNNEDWQLIIRDRGGAAVFGPAGEGAGASGVSDVEIGELEADPTSLITPLSGFDDGDASTFGEPNGFDGRLQDFSLIRPTPAVDTEEPDAVLDSPGVGEVLTDTSVVVRGSASDDVGVGRVSVALKNRDTDLWLQADGSFGSFKFLEAVLDAPGDAETGWSFPVDLSEGNWFVSVRASDTSGNVDSTRAIHRFSVQTTIA